MAAATATSTLVRKLYTARNGVVGGRRTMTLTVADTDRSIPACFEQRSRERAGEKAVGGTVWQPTFAELDAAANRLAHVLLERTGVDSGRIAMLLRHDTPLIAAVLAVLKAGRTAVVLHPGDPPARLAQIRRDAEPQLLLTEESLRGLARTAGFAATDLVSVEARPDCSAHPAPGVTVGADDLAFLIYTSGSTGEPKAVMQTHRNMLHNVLRQSRCLDLRADDRYALLASIGGGQGIGVVWAALLNGATVCPFAVSERGVAELPAWFDRHGVNVLACSSTLFRNFVRTLSGRRLSGIRLVRLASEPALRGDLEAHCRHFAEDCVLVNTLSSSETGNITCARIAPDLDVADGLLPVGRPSEGMDVTLIDREGAEVPPGQVGEIVVRSKYLSPGYWQDETQTAIRFSSESRDPATRIFRTGDLGRLRPDGLLTVVGRTDLQVKVRGNRVGVEEVERAIAALAEVTAVAVGARTAARGDTHLTGYVVAREGSATTVSALREELRTTLPEHAIPTAFVFLDSLPVTPHGKVDRARLASLAPRPPAAVGTTVGGHGTIGEDEEMLAAMWADALELDFVGRDQRFLDLGGESLMGAVIAAKVFEAFAVRLGLHVFADNPTVASMARLLRETRSSAVIAQRPQLVRAPRAQALPLSFAQEQTWLAGRAATDPIAYNVAVPVCIRGPLDVDALRRGVNAIVARHEILRTTFEETDRRPVQVVHPVAELELQLVDLRHSAEPLARADEILQREACIPFDLERAPLLRLSLLRIGEAEHRLLRVNHHIISDAWSWKVFFDELAVLYTAHLAGRSAALPELPVQYGDFAAWERSCLDPSSSRHREEVTWWTRTLASSTATPMRLPFERPVPAQDMTPADGTIWWGIEPEASRRLDQLGRESGATYFMVRLAVFAAQLALETGREDVVLGTMVNLRSLPQLYSLFGFFSDLATIRFRGANDWSFRQWLHCVRAAIIATTAHTQLPYPELTRELRLRGTTIPTIETLFASVEVNPAMRFAGLEIRRMNRCYGSMPWEFTFVVDRWREHDGCLATFNACKHDPDGVRSFIERYKRLALAVCAEPDTSVCELLRTPTV